MPRLDMFVAVNNAERLLQKLEGQIVSADAVAMMAIANATLAQTAALERLTEAVLALKDPRP